MSYKKQRIQIYQNIHQNGKGSAATIEREAFCVNNAEGVFAVWKEGAVIHMASGDDGFWDEIAAYHESWLKDIIQVLVAIT